jgi:hypothetical protein
MSDTLVGFLAVKLGTHPENVATEALNYILRSVDARRGFLRLVANSNGIAPESLRFRTQASDEDGARPDIVGERTDGSVSIIIEAKFWAGLTDNQPVAYLKNLPAGSLLMFVAPEKRFELLWAEIVRKIADSGLGVSAPNSIQLGFRSALCGDKTLALTSWRALLSAIAAAVETAGDVSTSADVRQLVGLCERMDSEAFLPLTSDELCPTWGRRVVQFGQIASDLTDLLVGKGLASVKGCKASAGNGWSGRYLRIHGYGAYLHCSFWKWPKLGCSPIWLELKGPDFKPMPIILDVIKGSGIQFFDWHGNCAIPIFIRPGVERDELIADALEQVIKVVSLLKTVAIENAPPLPPPGDDSAPESPAIVETHP